MKMWILRGIFFAIFAVAYVNSQCNPSPCGVNTQCEVRNGGAAVCRCIQGYNHLPGQSTIDGCPTRESPSQSSPPRRTSSGSNSIRFQSQRPVNRQPPRQTIISAGNACQPNPCGTNAECSVKGNRAVCTCRAGSYGDPYSNCQVNPCDQDPCGINAECENTGARAICKCPRGFTGDPFVRCNDNPCSQDPCGQNADCEAQGARAVCRCRDGYEGDPFVRCTLNPCLTSPCGVNAECKPGGQRAVCECRDGYEGDPFVSCELNPCFNDPCGANADCNSRGRSAVCQCRPGYVGDPFVNCQLEPCSQDPCGTNAECESQGRSAICRCPRGYSGDPYTNCIRDPCATNPCGANALCENNGNAAICKCPPEHVGDPYVSCTFDPCALNSACGPNTECSVSGQRSICRCIRGYTGSPTSRQGCIADPCSVNDICGQNAECRNEGGRPTCQCLSGHKGDPYQGCVRGDCISNSECPDNKACQDYKCVDPCQLSCGSGADCDVNNHVAICRCPRGFTGDPFQSCRKFTKDEICEACGANTDCEVGEGDRPICRCKKDYIGNPLQGCRRECESSRDCSAQQECVQFRCLAACREGACGENANCQARNNRAQCECPPDFLGDPNSRCYTECTRHDECSATQACVRFSCKDPCREPDPNVCGSGANCEVKNHKPICSCPRGFTGDPFQSCREFTKQDLCNPNPCGPGATCQPGNDRSGSDRPVCTCPKGYRGDPLVSCTRGECENDSECSSSQACFNFKCKDACLDACGINAQCKALNHGAICSCPDGYVGDALTACREQRNRQVQNTRVIGLSRFRRDLNEYFSSFFA